MLKKRLSRQSPRKFELKVVAEDGAPADKRLRSKQTITLLVHSADEDVPRFEKSIYQFVVSENRPVGTPVGRISAVDQTRGA